MDYLCDSHRFGVFGGRLAHQEMEGNALNHIMITAGILLGMAALTLPAALADSVDTWAYTLDFDNGIFSDSVGSLEVSTNTCNGMIPENVVSIDSISGDAFCIDDSDGVTWKWIQGTSSADAAPDQCVVSVDTGKAKIFRDYTGGGSIRSCFFIGTSTFSGDFDVRIVWEYVNTAVNGNPRPTLCVWDTQSVFTNWGLNCDNANQYEGMYYQYTRTLGFLAYLHPPGGPSFQVGGTTTVTACDTIGVECWFRITRIGTTYSWYYSIEGNGWVLDETTTDATFVNSLYPWFGTVTNTQLDDGEIWFDNFTVDSTIDAGGFRLSGTWESQAFSVGTDVLSFVDFIHIAFVEGSNVSAVERIDLLVSGIIVESWVGYPMSPVISVTETTGDNLSLRFSFSGYGNGAPILGIVSAVALSNGGGGLPIADWVFWVLLLILACVLLIIGVVRENGILVFLSGLAFLGLGVLLLPTAPVILWGMFVSVGGLQMLVGAFTQLDRGVT